MTTTSPEAPTAPSPTPTAPAPSPADWRSSLPAELKEHPSLKDLKDVPSLATKLINAEKLVGAKGIIKPGKDAKPEEWDSYYNALGRPEKIDGYKLPEQGMPEGIAFDESRLNKYREAAHKLGLTDQQFSGMARMYAEDVHGFQQSQGATSQQAIASNVQALKQKWGAAYEQNDQLATDAIMAFGGQELFDLLRQNPSLSTNPMLVEAFAKMGREIKEDEIKGTGGRTTFAHSPAEATAAIDAKYKDPEFMKAYSNPSDPGHAKAVEEMRKLYEARHPPEKQPGT
jgi:hypothetical protein